jgi:hypothetical protein
LNDQARSILSDTAIAHVGVGDDAGTVIDGLAKKYLDADSYPFRQPGEVRVTVVIQPD